MRKPPKTLVIGCESFIGKEFLRTYRSFYVDTLGTDYQSLDARRKLDLSFPDLAPLQLKKGEYTYALIAAANADPAFCEKEKKLSFQRNVEGTLKLVRSLVKLEIQPILFSSAYVFDGIEGNYDESSTTRPINEYGKQKEILEKEVPQICGNNYLIIRCSKIFDLVKGNGTLLDQIFSQLLKNKRINAAFDQFFSPLLLQDLVEAVLLLQKKGYRGLYNIGGKEIWNRLDLVETIATELQVNPSLITPILLDQLQTPYKMPKRTNLNCEKLHKLAPFSTASLSFCINKFRSLYLNEVRNDRSSFSREEAME